MTNNNGFYSGQLHCLLMVAGVMLQAGTMCCVECYGAEYGMGKIP